MQKVLASPGARPACLGSLPLQFVNESYHIVLDDTSLAKVRKRFEAKKLKGVGKSSVRLTGELKECSEYVWHTELMLVRVLRSVSRGSGLFATKRVSDS